MAISRMQEPRQLYGLGSLVKKIGKTIKKVVKSPIGKAAILGLGGYALGGGFGPGGFAFKNIPGFTGAKNLLMGSPLGFKTAGDSVARSGGIFNLAKKFMGSTAGQVGIGAALSALAASGMDQEEIAEIENDPEKLKMYLKDYYSKTNPDASGAEIEEFVRINSAVGGRVGLEKGGSAFEEYKQDLEDGIISPDTTFNEWLDNNAPDPDYDKSFAIGGRVGLESGTPKKGLESISIKDLPLIKGPYMIKYDEDGNPIKYPKPKGEPYRIQYDEEGNRKKLPERVLLRNKSAMGGRIGLEAGANKDFQEYLKGKKKFQEQQNLENEYRDYLEDKRRQKVAVQKTMAANGGLMPMGQMRMNKAGTIERDYRETGGFVPVGIKEKADDVPAMLSKNEFVMTADAVRGIGDGNIEKGAQRLYDQMKQAEKRVV